MQKRTMTTLVLLAAAVAAGCAQESGTPAGEAAATADTARTEAAATAESVADQVSLTGDAEAGKRVYIYCQSCHSINEGGMNKVGPNLYGVYGKAAGQAAGFVYSEGLSTAGIVWDDDTLNQWIERPTALVPGTTMLFAGITDPQQRADLIAYLKQNSN